MGYLEQIKYFTASDGVKVGYVDIGSGQPLFYIPGFGGYLEANEWGLNEYAKNFRVISMSYRGMGKITPASKNMGYERVARDIEELICFLGLENVILDGTSMGAHLVYSYIEMFGCGKLRNVVINDMTPKIINERGWKLGLYQGYYTRDMADEDLEYLRKGDTPSWGTRLVTQTLYPMDPKVDRDISGSSEDIIVRTAKYYDMDPDVLRGYVTEFGKEVDELIPGAYEYWRDLALSDFRSVLPHISVPTLMFFGEPGNAYQRATAEYTASQIPNCTLQQLGTTHTTAGTPEALRTYIDTIVKTFNLE